MTISSRMIQRHDTAANWTDIDPVLAAGEIGVEDDTGQFKIGDGTSLWSELDYYAAGGGTVDADDVDDTTATHKFATAAQLAKVDNLTVTQAVDLDTIEARVNQLDAAVVLKGPWDASAGTFPGGGTAQAGDSYIVSVAGTVNAVAFSVGDRIIAIVDNASTGTYAANWLKLDYTDLVTSVAGRTGAVTIGATDVAITDTGGNFTATDVEGALEELASSGTSTPVPIKEEGTTVVADPSAINFVGASVTVTDVGGVATVTITDATLTTEQVQDIIGALVAGSGGLLSVTYDDAGNTLTIGLTTEVVQDAIGALLTDNTVTDIVYDDAGNALTITLMAGAVANSMLANMAQATIKGRASGAGTGAPTDLSAAQAAAIVASSLVTQVITNGVTTTAPSEDAVFDALALKQDIAQSVNAQTGTTYTLVAGDAGKLVTLSNASAITLTVPQDSDATIAVGTYIDLYQLGAGQVTVVAGTGATLRVSGLTAKARAQYARFGVQKVSANTWSLFGDLAAS